MASVSFKVSSKCAQGMALVAEQKHLSRDEFIVQALESKVTQEQRKASKKSSTKLKR